MPTAVELPVNFREIPEISNAVDSSLNSISTGIQAALNSPALQIGDSLESFSACFSRPGDSPKPLQFISDAGGIAAPETYFHQAKGFGGESLLKTFSNLAPMTRVFEHLADANFTHQKSLQSFHDLLANLIFGGAGAGKFPLDEASSFKLPGDAFGEKQLPGDAGFKVSDPGFIPKGISQDQKVFERDPGFIPPQTDVEGKFVPQDPGFIPPEKSIDSKFTTRDPGFILQGTTIDKKMIPDDPGFIPQGTTIDHKVIPDDAGFIPQGSGDLQRLFDFQNTLQEIVSLNQQIEEM